jgi:triphosphatase
MLEVTKAVTPFADNELRTSLVTEIKFLIPADSAAQLLATSLVRSALSGNVTKAFEKSIYFDTPRYMLRKNGCSLRIRHAGGRIEQTLTTEKRIGCGVLHRTEGSRTLKDSLLDNVFVQDALKQLSIARSARWQFMPLVWTELTRTKMPLRHRSTSFELVYDSGYVTSARHGRRMGQISEIEARLISGPAEGMFDLLARLNEKTSWIQFVTSKAERWFAAISSAHALKPVKHKPLVIPADMNTCELLQVSMANAMDHFFSNSPQILKAKPEAIHQTRVAIRRMRAFLRAFKDQIDYMDRKALNGELRWLQTKLGECRDWHVLRTDTLPKIKGLNPELRAELVGLCLRMHRKQLAQALQTYSSRRAQRLILHLQSWLARQPKTGGPSISKQRQSTLKANMKRLGKLGTLTPTRSVTEVHAMRIMVKKIRYTVEIFPGAEDEDTRLALQSLEKVQDALGDLNDACKALNLISVAVNENLSPELHIAVRKWVNKRILACIRKAQPHYKKCSWGAENNQQRDNLLSKAFRNCIAVRSS